jgi:uncharacterized protein (TIGR03083 family)
MSGAGSDAGEADLGALYRETRQRLSELVAGLDAAELATRVPACPDWAVRDVIAHVTALAQDIVAGRLQGLPTNEDTAAQVARLADVGAGELLDLWAAVAPQFEQLVRDFRVWPAVIDLATHEQDVRGAVGRPGARDCAAIRLGAALLMTSLSVPAALRVVLEDGEFVVGPDGGADGGDGAAELTLSTTRFEAFRWRMGRRSRAQLAGLHWSGDPAPVLDHLCVFGPASRDIIE